MKGLFLVLLMSLMSTPTLSGEATATIPPGGASANGATQCENLRVFYGFRMSDWIGEPGPTDDFDACASLSMRAGLLEETVRQANISHSDTMNVCSSIANDARDETISDFHIDWPLPFPQVACGDGILDDGVDGNEECDDGNTEDGDGCDGGCQNE